MAQRRAILSMKFKRIAPCFARRSLWFLSLLCAPLGTPWVESFRTPRVPCFCTPRVGSFRTPRVPSIHTPRVGYLCTLPVGYSAPPRIGWALHAIRAVLVIAVVSFPDAECVSFTHLVTNRYSVLTTAKEVLAIPIIRSRRT